MDNLYWSDLDNRLQILPNGDIKVRENLDALACAVENSLLIQKGERVMRPEFGSILEKYLYEPLSEETGYLIGTEIIRAVKDNESRVEVSSVDVKVDLKKACYFVTIVCSLVNEPNLSFTIVKILTRSI